jgi:Ligated ion channel L-glutamate- and glycine-binding site/Ligand-gated ion channel
LTQLSIADNEDPFAPSITVESVLTEIRKINCGIYLILIENGIQMERLLRFGDKTRILDTRARYIILYDYRLFDASVLYVWRRIVNVIFIRQYDTTKQGTLNTGSWFELSTVPYPNGLKGIIVTKRLDFWRGGRFRYNRPLFADTTNDLNGFVMKAVVLEHVPAVMRATTNVSVRYSGLEVEILQALGQAVNFKVEFFETDDAASEKWGHGDKNGTFSGVLGAIDSSTADFALADLHYTPYHLEILDLSVPYNTECLTFLTPESQTDNSWKTLILPFSGVMWACVLTSLLLVGFVFYAFAHFYLYLQRDWEPPSVGCLKIGAKLKDRIRLWRRKSAVEPRTLRFVATPTVATPYWRREDVARNLFNSLFDCVVYTYSMSLLVSLPKLPTGWSLRLLTGWYWVYCILLVVSYRSAMTAILANPVKRLFYDTVDELAADSDMGYGAWGEENRNLFLGSVDEPAQKIGANMELIENADEAVTRIIKGKFAFYESTHYLQKLRSRSFEAHNSDATRLHQMRDCVVTMPVSIGFEKNSPLKPRADKVILSLIESGLVQKWLVDAKMGLVSEVEAPPKVAIMDLSKFVGALVALAIGCSVAVFVLLGEKVYWKYFIVRRHPLYDPYELAKLYRRPRPK